MKFAMRLLSNGKIVTGWDTGVLRADRDDIGIGETFELINLDPVPPIPTDNFDIPNINVYTQPTEFVSWGRLVAFHDDNIDVINYWLDHKTECIERGGELGMTPPERYFWERIIGRMASGDAVAKFGPYAGLVDDNQSRTP